MLLLGIDLGSSAIKASLLDIESGRVAASAQSPHDEMPMISQKTGWAEQDPELWWKHAGEAVRAALKKAGKGEVAAVGIAYQMHGLVVVGADRRALRPAIIWCDSRAVGIGERAFVEIGTGRCLRHLLNSPGNFTASKLRWVQENEPEIYRRIHKFMLPGDYLAMRLTGEIQTTASGLSEGMLWDFEGERPASLVLNHFGFDPALVPEVVPTLAPQARLSPAAASEFGLSAGIPVSYRAGDQPNNAFSLKALDPGEVAATAGTSGVIYGVIGRPAHDPLGRVNLFAHVNHRAGSPRLGVLLCINGTGILYSWLKRQAGRGIDYGGMDRMAGEAPAGSEGLCVLPFGNGAERMLANRSPGCRWSGLNFNRHTLGHLLRAAQEGIAFSFRHGIEGMKACGLDPGRLRAGNANLFKCGIFRETLATILGVPVDIIDTDGAAGAARAAGIGAGIYASPDEAFRSLELLSTSEPNFGSRGALEKAYGIWEAELRLALG